MFMKFNSKYLIENGKEGKKLVLKSKWNPSIKDVMIKEDVFEIELNSEKGFKIDNYGLDFLKEIEFITGLYIIDFKLKNVKAVNCLKNLRHLDLSIYCDIEIDFSRFSKLESCAMIWSKKANSIFSSKSLKELYIDGFPEADSQNFSSVCKLESLTLINSNLAEIEKLRYLKRLNKLILSGGKQIQSLKGIENLSNLRILDIEDCSKITSLNEIANLKNLAELNISNIKRVESLYPLRGLKNLETLYFYENTDISDGVISFLKELPRLKDVRFKDRKHYDTKREVFAPWRTKKRQDAGSNLDW